MTTLVALDVDGVLVAFSKNKHLDGYAELYEKEGDRTLKLKWRKDGIERLKRMLDRPDVVVAALTTWSWYPDEFDELKKLMDIENLMHFDSEVPYFTGGWGKVQNPRFPGKVELDRANHPSWWKYRAFELLLEDGDYDRAAWVDDNLGRLPSWRPCDNYSRLLLRTHESAALLPKDLDTLENWLNRTRQDYDE